MANTPKNELPKIGSPATNALNAIGIFRLEQVAQHTEKELLAVHGVGAKAIRILREKLAEKGLAFAEKV